MDDGVRGWFGFARAETGLMNQFPACPSATRLGDREPRTFPLIMTLHISLGNMISIGISVILTNIVLLLIFIQ